MNKIGLFQSLLNDLNENCPTDKDYFKYIGTGNPNAKILVVGKEAAIPESSTEQIQLEIESNFNQWKEIKDFDQSNIQSNSSFTPLYPYKGQKLKIDNGHNHGTSRTWYNYQKLHNRIYDLKNDDQINFHEGFFITETNASPSKKTIDADKESLSFRKKHLLSSEFIKSFPVIVIAGVGYYEISDTKNEIEELFEVKFHSKRYAQEEKSQPYWLHYNEDRSRLLINTYQLSMGISDSLLDALAKEIRDSNLLTNI